MVLEILFTSIGLGIIGQLSLKKGMINTGKIYLKINNILNTVKTLSKEKFVVIGLSIYLISVVLWLIVLSKVDLSYAYPTLSISYVLTALLSRSFFKENVSKFRWLSIIIISIGVVMVVYS